MASYVSRGLGAIAAAGVLALTATPPAKATVTVGDCTVTAIAPAPVTVRSDGKKVSVARAQVRCARLSFRRLVEFELQLWEDDSANFFYGTLDFDDFKGTTRWSGRSFGTSFRIVPGTVPLVPCYDDYGDVQLYSKVRARITTSVSRGGEIEQTKWSPWDKGGYYRYNCR